MSRSVESKRNDVAIAGRTSCTIAGTNRIETKRHISQKLSIGEAAIKIQSQTNHIRCPSSAESMFQHAQYPRNTLSEQTSGQAHTCGGICCLACLHAALQCGGAELYKLQVVASPVIESPRCHFFALALSFM